MCFFQIVACCCPPLAVCCKKGCGVDCCVTFLLTILGWLPGCFYACYIVSKDEKAGTQVNQITNIQMPAAAPAQHITVNVPQQFHSPTPMNNPYPQYPTHPMAMNNPHPSTFNGPPPMYSSAPPYYGEAGEGDGVNKC